MSSTAPAAQQALVELLAAALPTVHVAFAGSGKLPKTNELVFVLPVRNYHRAPGEQSTIEGYELAIRVEVFRSGEETGQDADARRWELIDAVDAELRRTDFKGYYSRGGELATAQESLDLYDKGWVASSVVTFAVEGRQ